MDREFLSDLFADFGPVTIRRMFSGYGISVDGVNFALSLRAGLFFRADDETIPRFEAEGSKPFSYQTSTRSVTVASYWQLPARLFDDTEELGEWARAALGAAQRAALKKRPRKPRSARSGKGQTSAAPAKKQAAKAKPAKASKKKVSKKVAAKPSSRKARTRAPATKRRDASRHRRMG
jgi:DNA transformation protein